MTVGIFTDDCSGDYSEKDIFVPLESIQDEVRTFMIALFDMYWNQ